MSPGAHVQDFFRVYISKGGIAECGIWMCSNSSSSDRLLYRVVVQIHPSNPHRQSIRFPTVLHPPNSWHGQTFDFCYNDEYEMKAFMALVGILMNSELKDHFVFTDHLCFFFHVFFCVFVSFI